MSQTHYIYIMFSSEKPSCLLKKNYRDNIVLVEKIVSGYKYSILKEDYYG